MSSADSLEFRRIGPGLVDALADFFGELERGGDTRQFHPHPFDRETAERLAQAEGRDLYYAAVAGGRVLAYGMLRGWDEGFEVPSLGIAVAPTARGRGLGRSLMLFLHAAARLRGASRIRLKVYEDNAAALALYRDLGYAFGERETGQLVGILALDQG